MSDRELLIKIAQQLTGIEKRDMSQAELKIVEILVDDGILVVTPRKVLEPFTYSLSGEGIKS